MIFQDSLFEQIRTGIFLFWQQKNIAALCKSSARNGNVLLFIFILTRFRVYFFFLRVTVKAAPANETAATPPITIAPTLKSAVCVGVGMPPVLLLPAATTAVVVTTGVAGCVTGNVVAIVV